MNDGDRIQPGIAFRSGERPSPSWRLLLLNADPEATPTAVHGCLAAVHELLAALAGGEVRELAGLPAPQADRTSRQFEGLQHLVAFGRRLFDSELTTAPRPEPLSYLPADGPFPALRWQDSAAGRNRGESDIAVQLTGNSQAAVNCAAVEVWKLLQDTGAPLRAAASFDGFARLDGRGWLEFHDGVSNMHSSQRRFALAAPPDPAWMADGTYMAFLRIVIDLAVWRRLTRQEQEVVVGRDKLTGAGLIGTQRLDDRVVPVPAPVPGEDADDRAAADHIEPPQTTDPLVEVSHVHRANQLRSSPWATAALRMFRQGYEFLEDIDGTPQLGLNFVSFQRDLSVVHHVLHLPGWLGDVDFGGTGPLHMLTVSDGGLYAVPPVDQPFPGASIFVGRN